MATYGRETIFKSLGFVWASQPLNTILRFAKCLDMHIVIKRLGEKKELGESWQENCFLALAYVHEF